MEVKKCMRSRVGRQSWECLHRNQIMFIFLTFTNGKSCARAMRKSMARQPEATFSDIPTVAGEHDSDIHSSSVCNPSISYLSHIRHCGEQSCRRHLNRRPLCSIGAPWPAIAIMMAYNLRGSLRLTVCSFPNLASVPPLHMTDVYTRTVTIFSRTGGILRDTTLMLAFKPIEAHLQVDQFPICWKVIKFPKNHNMAFTCTYTSKVGVAFPQVEGADLVQGNTFTDLNRGETTSLVQAKGDTFTFTVCP